MSRAAAFVPLALACLLATSAHADPRKITFVAEPVPPPKASAALAATADPWAAKSFVIGARVGMGFPQLFSKLRNFGVYEVEGGYILPSWGKRLQLSLGLGYSEPGSGNGLPDPRLAASGASYRWDLSQRELTVDLGLIVRFLPFGARIAPYAKVGFRLYMLNTVIDGQAAGESFGRYDEKFTEPGFSVGGGVELRLGPGALGAELRVDFSNMNRRITGDSNTGMLSLLVGYRFFL